MSRQRGCSATASDGAAWVVSSQSQTSDGCVVIPGYGPVCGHQNSADFIYARDYFREGVGALGSDHKGCVPGFGCATTFIGLIDASVAGDRPAPACVDIKNNHSDVPVIAAKGNAPTPKGGALIDGLYQLTAAKVYGTTMYGTATPAGTQLGLSFSGMLKLAAGNLESVYETTGFGTDHVLLSAQRFYGKATFTIAGATVNVAFSCSAKGAVTSSFAYSVTDPSTLDITTRGADYTLVTTYSRKQ